MMDRTVYYTHRSLYAPPRISSSRDERESPATTIELSLVEEKGGWGLYAAEGQGYIWLMPHPAPPGGGEYTLMSCWMADDPRQMSDDPRPSGGGDGTTRYEAWIAGNIHEEFDSLEEAREYMASWGYTEYAGSYSCEHPYKEREYYVREGEDADEDYADGYCPCITPLFEDDEDEDEDEDVIDDGW